MVLKVIQVATGQVGRYALRSIIEHPDLELVGLLVHSPGKAGRDAGELCGLPDVGVRATTDLDQVLALEADCVAHYEWWDGGNRLPDIVNQVEKFLRSGKNVVSASLLPFVCPRTTTVDPQFGQRLQAACRAGGVSLLNTGINPGWAADILPLVVTGLGQRIDHVRLTEIMDFSTYDHPEELLGGFGFGEPVEMIPPFYTRGSRTMAWREATLESLAESLGVTLDDVQVEVQRAPAVAAIEYPFGKIEAGAAAAAFLKIHGIVGGKVVLSVEQVTRMHPHVAPDWPQPLGVGGYRVLVEGDPRLELYLTMNDAAKPADPQAGPLFCTATPTVNSIPAICAAVPGVYSGPELGLLTGKGLIRI
ncbi:NAD(P)H-dependent amine dehydrogenase family protein [Mycobacterium sp.]|uniref:NAD(P)H-dependent amine dehydrogenase family protein n=1 Tax=Mycobacterium sp. TaxID=1785 RepID=UPI003D127EE9